MEIHRSLYTYTSNILLFCTNSLFIFFCRKLPFKNHNKKLTWIKQFLYTLKFLKLKKSFTKAMTKLQIQNTHCTE